MRETSHPILDNRVFGDKHYQHNFGHLFQILNVGIANILTFLKSRKWMNYWEYGQISQQINQFHSAKNYHYKLTKNIN